jgi:hypothetical protein
MHIGADFYWRDIRHHATIRSPLRHFYSVFGRVANVFTNTSATVALPRNALYVFHVKQFVSRYSVCSDILLMFHVKHSG